MFPRYPGEPGSRSTTDGPAHGPLPPSPLELAKCVQTIGEQTSALMVKVEAIESRLARVDLNISSVVRHLAQQSNDLAVKPNTSCQIPASDAAPRTSELFSEVNYGWKYNVHHGRKATTQISIALDPDSLVLQYLRHATSTQHRRGARPWDVSPSTTSVWEHFLGELTPTEALRAEYQTVVAVGHPVGARALP